MEEIIEQCRYKRLTHDSKSGTYRVYRLTCHLDYGDYGNDWDCVYKTTLYNIAFSLFEKTPNTMITIDDRYY